MLTIKNSTKRSHGFLRMGMWTIPTLIVLQGGCKSNGEKRADAPRSSAHRSAAIAVPEGDVAVPTDSMTAHYINVGQGASALLEFPCGAILIDTGAQDQEYVDHLVDYLNTFFARRTDLDRTLDSIIVSHQHEDHAKGLKKVVENFTVKRMVENGLDHGSGFEHVKWVRDHAHNGGRNIKIVKVRDSQVTAGDNVSGFTNADIDPVNCSPVNPKIVILSGQMDDNPGWNDGDMENGNNHSLVVRIDFGESSFLFTGDLEDAAIETMVDYYSNTSALDVDVYHVGHHGSYNGTTEPLLAAMSPEAAVISVGPWNFGEGKKAGIFTWVFGHPRKSVVQMLSQSVTGNRTPAKTVKVAKAAKKFEDMTVQKAIYATGWDGDIRITARQNGTMTFATSP